MEMNKFIMSSFRNLVLWTRLLQWCHFAGLYKTVLSFEIFR